MRTVGSTRGLDWMYCCWLRSTWGAMLLSSSSVPK
ncbi:hypothetical protein Cadr_000000728 [Camelus dromedarius]|uniref:Uncharacterized protein n=1 Tax=Camelus dromedarius TaxID=9838 RepID=A0A5N4EJS8_CAMDR|nr:hypothetical protein Cadr_000000728 [Camelus dromedarius]